MPERPENSSAESTVPTSDQTAAPASASLSKDTASSLPDDQVAFVKRRLHSLDAYRGLIMITLAFGGFGVAKTAELHLAEDPNSPFWIAAKYQTSHVEWVGCSYWDLIQPSFMFMVGVSMAYSYVRRKREGQPYLRMLGHAAWRSLILILLGVFLVSGRGSMTNWSLTNVLTQIGLGYTFLFLLWGRRLRTQWIVAVALLLGTWGLYVGWPGAGVNKAGSPLAGVGAPWTAEHLQEIRPAWHKNASAGHYIDVWLLNMLPREKPFEFNRGGYTTINFVPSLVTMLFGLMCGELLRSNRRERKKLLLLAIAGSSALAIGYLLNLTTACPMVKRIWTPSWTLFSTGWCCWILATMYFVVDILRLRVLALPLIVVGMNSMAIYCMGMLLKPWTATNLKRHFSSDLFLMFGELYAPMVQATMVGLCFWLVCCWMYRQKIFLRI